MNNQSTVFLQDCMEYMKTVPDKHFDLAVVDPEYGINASKGTWGSSNCGRVKDYGKKLWDKESVNQEVLNEIIRISKDQIIWGANHFISKIPFDSSCWIVWDKLKTGDFADCELAYTSFTTAVKKFTFRWNGMLQQDMNNKEIRIHPTQKL
jgi:site-specific DNA-methyltransferase (adenine-specific)